MYKARQNKWFYIAVETFPITAKEVSKVYHSGIRLFTTQDMYYFTIVIYRFRIMFGKKRFVGSCMIN